MIDPRTLDLATLATLAGDLSTDFLLRAIRARGHTTVRTAHGYLFQHLIEGAPTVSELAELMGVTQQAASKSVVELEEFGLVARSPDPSDSRVRRVSLTDAGTRAVADARAERAALEARLLAAVGESHLEAAKTVLTTLVDIVGGTDSIRERRVRLAR